MTDLLSILMMMMIVMIVMIVMIHSIRISFKNNMKQNIDRTVVDTLVVIRRHSMKTINVSRETTSERKNETETASGTKKRYYVQMSNE